MSNLVELFDNIVQMQNLNGVPLANGKMYVYALGRTRLMDTWSDVDGESLNSNPIILDAAGQCHCYVTDDFDYTIVVTDAYDNEIFSIDKYLYSKGSHSHADVAVAPSETIAVSSYHVGECTVYVPYLTGQLGKVYEGIDPIVVNNTEDKISANHVPLGVQDPLYFVQDDEEGCIIGLSGGTVPEGTMNESAFGYENGQITGYNGSAFSAGNTYEEGSYISIANNTISVSGLTPVPADTASTGLVASVSADITAMIPDTSDMATQTWVNEQGFLTAHQSLDGLMSADLLEFSGSVITAYSGHKFAGEISGDAGDAEVNALVHSNSATWDSVTDKLDTSAFSTVSGDFLTAHQSLEGYATENWVTSQGYLTGVDIPESATWNATTETVSANSAQWGASNPQIPVTGINGIKISESADKVVFEVSADYATEDWVTAQGYLTTAYNPEFAYHDTAISSIDSSALYDTSAHARINTLAGRISDLSSNKLDTSAFSDVSGTFLTAHQDLSDYQTIAGMTAYQPVGSYLTADALDTVSGDWNEVSAKLDTTAFSDVSGNFLTAHQDISNKLDTTAFSDVSGSFLTAVPDTYLQNTDLSTEDGKVTAISGIPLSAGGDVPEGVMVESAVEYNAVNEISGYNGSAIAQYGAEKQWLTHDDTIVHISNSAQYAFGVNLSGISADLARMMGVDETVLWSGSTKVTTANTITLSEPLTAFNKFRIYDVPFRIGSSPYLQQPLTETTLNNVDNGQNYLFGTVHGWVDTWQSTASGSKYRGYCFYSGDSDLTHLLCMGSFINSMGLSGKYDMRNEGYIYKIVGIGRRN